MKLTIKWFIWFGGIGIYVMCLGGIFYYNLFKWTFDKRLQEDSVNMVRNWAPMLQKGLGELPSAITLPEMDIMSALSQDQRIAHLLYLNRNGTIRWCTDTTLWGASFDDYIAKFGELRTDAIKQAYVSKSFKIRAVPQDKPGDPPLYEIAIPLSRQKGGGADVIGLIDIKVSREGVDRVIKSAMQKYILGAIGVLVLIGGPLFFFMHHFILGPMGFLRDALDSVTVRNLELKLQPRKDEIGELAASISSLLAKLKAELDVFQSRETERMAAEEQWWSNILKVVVGVGAQAIVMDEDNSVLYTNFELKTTAAPGQKIHLLDVVDTQQQELLQLAGRALEMPNELLEGETVFRGVPCQVKIMHLAGQGPHRRTLILFDPKRESVPHLGLG